MQFYTCVSVIMVSMLLFHTHTEAYQAQKVVPANPSKCSSDVTTSYVISRRFLSTGVQTVAIFVNCVCTIRITQ